MSNISVSLSAKMFYYTTNPPTIKHAHCGRKLQKPEAQTPFSSSNFIRHFNTVGVSVKVINSMQ